MTEYVDERYPFSGPTTAVQPGGNGRHQQGIPPEPEGPPSEVEHAPAPAPAPRGALKNWQPFTLRDAYQERAPVAYAVGKLFELPSVNIVYGAPGCLKSFLLADLAVCVASGNPWLQPLPGENGEALTVHPGPVVWLDFDNGQRRTHDRFAALGRALKLPEETPLYYYSMPSPWLNSDSKGQVAELSELIKGHGARLVVIDNLGAVTPTVDENSPEIIRVFSNLRWLAETTGAAVVVIHHQRKSNGFKTRKGESLRGHSGIEAALDLALLIERSEEQRTNLVVAATKSRGQEVEPFGGIFAVEFRPDGELHAARFFGKPVLSDELVMVATIRAAILASLAAGEEVKKGELVTRTQAKLSGIGEKRITGIIDLLLEQGVLNATYGPHRSQLISKTSDENGAEEAE